MTAPIHDEDDDHMGPLSLLAVIMAVLAAIAVLAVAASLIMARDLPAPAVTPTTYGPPTWTP